MTFGNRRKKRKKKNAAFGGLKARREKKEKLLEAQQRKMDKFRVKHPAFAEALDQIRTKAAEGYQIPKTDYGVPAHSFDLYELISGLHKEERTSILEELGEIFSQKSNATMYLALMKAASVPGFNEKTLSKHAQKIRTAMKNRVPLDEFEQHRKGVKQKNAVGWGRKK